MLKLGKGWCKLDEEKKPKKRSKIDWATLRSMYMEDPEMLVQDLSAEKTGNLNRPAHASLKAIAAKEKWKLQRDEKYGYSTAPRSTKKAKQYDRTTDGARATAIVESRVFAPDKLAEFEHQLSNPLAVLGEDKGYALEDLPEHLQQRYSSAIADPHLMNIRGDVALYSSLITSCTRRMKTGEPSSRFWRKIRDAAKEIISAKRAGDEAIAAQKLSDLLKMVAQGCPEVELQDELIKLIDGRMRTIAAESTRLKLLQQFIGKEDALNIMRQVAEVIKDNVHDSKALIAIASEFKRIRQGISIND